jgi:hypothetical protein
MNIPSGTTINWFASNNGGATWEPMSIQTTREIDQEWTEYTLTRNLLRSERKQGPLQGGDDRQQPGVPEDSHPRRDAELIGGMS